jgi:hypothetical protein
MIYELPNVKWYLYHWKYHIYIAGYTMIELTNLIRNTGGAWIHRQLPCQTKHVASQKDSLHFSWVPKVNIQKDVENPKLHIVSTGKSSTNRWISTSMLDYPKASNWYLLFISFVIVVANSDHTFLCLGPEVVLLFTTSDLPSILNTYSTNVLAVRTVRFSHLDLDIPISLCLHFTF